MKRAAFAVLAALAALFTVIQAQTTRSGSVFLYAAVGTELSTYLVNTTELSLTKASSVMLPFPVQYAWPHPSTNYLYVAWSNGMQGDRHGITAYRVDAATGALAPHGGAIEI